MESGAKPHAPAMAVVPTTDIEVPVM
ncbi:unnamed protein product [Cuscuta epithymum]|uniref:Uncharacterized protein n=1 Tax=Cuscuta epithymum TaxID=186058 RepID=A0AAV0EE99_9ASTE|nr:unnamed protein product [Cuscuta epithymum]